MMLSAKFATHGVGGVRICWERIVITCGPTNGGQIEVRIIGVAVISEPRNAGIDSKYHCGRNAVGVPGGKRVTVIVLGTAVRAKAGSQRIDGQIQDVPVIESQKESLLVGDVVIQTGNHLVMVAPSGGCNDEVVGRCRWIYCCGPKIKQFFGGSIDSVRRNYIVQEWSGSRVAPGQAPCAFTIPAQGS